jgi:hypothetical protein
VVTNFEELLTEPPDTYYFWMLSVVRMREFDSRKLLNNNVNISLTFIRWQTKDI